MKDKLDRKEFFMQNKERKWLEIEKILEEYVHEDDELRDRLLELRVNVSAASTKKISNVVQENDKLKVQLDNAHEEIARMRKQLLTIGGLKEAALDNLESNFTPKNGEIIEDEEEEYDEEEYEEEDEEGEDPETRSAGESKKSTIVPSKIIAQRFSKHRANKKSFMSTAPLSAFIPKQPPGHHLGTIKPKLKVKETKSELKLYSEKLEEALAK
jgi:post-segregation antitoxin (ccd killing protein)